MSAISRRDFLKCGSAGLFGIGLLGLGLIEPSLAFATTPEKVNPGSFVDRKYLWHPSFSKTTVEKTNATYPFALIDDCYTKDNYHARNVFGHKYTNANQLSRIKGCAIRWTGGVYTDGTPVDMVLSVNGYSPNWRDNSSKGGNYNYFYATTVGELNPYHQELKPGINPGAPLFEFCGYAYIDLSFSFYKAGTNTPIKLAGHTSLTDVDWGERFRFDGVDSVYISNKNTHISINNDDSVEAEVGERDNLEDTTASIYFDTERFTLRYYGNPWKVGLCCFDGASLSTITPESPTKTFELER